MTTTAIRTTISHPLRIQRLRTKGWRMPEGAVYVGRPTIFGNPFWHAAQFHGVELSLKLYREMAAGCWNPSLLDFAPDHYVSQVYEHHREWLKRIGIHPTEALRELRGKQLACWCPLTSVCHADILCELANGEPT
jgi:hypothetical protein